MNANDPTHPCNPGDHLYPGLTIRDHIAIEAMKGLLTAGEYVHYRLKPEGSLEPDYHINSVIVLLAYDYADALIAESNRTE